MISSYRIDQDDLITVVSDGWQEFAYANGAPELSRSALGRPLWDFIAGRQTREVYQIIIDRVRSGVGPLAVPFRCDSPDVRRFMRLDLSPTEGGGVEFVAETLREERRDPVTLFDVDAERGGEMVTVCSWCKQVKVESDSWLEVEAAVERLDLLGRLRDPCPDGDRCRHARSRVPL